MDYNHPIETHKGKTVPKAIFSILIPTWNNLDILKICLNSIEKNSTYNHEIIIHVNEGKDGTLEWIKERGYNYTLSDKNVGVCYAMNAMSKLATTDYILYINDDMYACPKWDKYLYQAIEKKADNYFYFSSTMIEPKENKYYKCAIAPYNFGVTPETFEELAMLDFSKKITKKDWLGASWPPSIVHRELWDKVGGYSVEFSPGLGSDPDFSMKLWQAGVRDFKGIGNSLVYHFQSKSTVRIVKNNGRLQFAEKWGIPSSYLYKKMLRLGEEFNETPLELSKNLSYRFAQLRAIWIKLTA